MQTPKTKTFNIYKNMPIRKSVHPKDALENEERYDQTEHQKRPETSAGSRVDDYMSAKAARLRLGVDEQLGDVKKSVTRHHVLIS